MTPRRIRRRLFWGAVLLGLLVLVAVVSVLRVALWARDGLARRRPDLSPAY